MIIQESKREGFFSKLKLSTVFDYILQYNLHADNMVARHLVARIGSTQFLQKISHSLCRFKKSRCFGCFGGMN